MHRFALVGIWLVAAPGLSACTVDDTDDSADLAGDTADVGTWDAIAAIKLDTELMVEFYEPVPGALMVMQHGPVSAPPLDLWNRPVDIYRALAPELAVPEALVAAQARADELDGTEPETDPVAERRAIDAIALDYQTAKANVAVGYIDNQSCDDHWFDDEFCSVASAYDWDMCMLDHWNGAYATSGSINDAKFTACADIGNITLKVTISGYGGYWDVLEGHYYDYRFVSHSNEAARGDVINATNNRFHYAVGLSDW